ncbi:outer membrane beta-barrel protein, partial [Ideonella sp.]|uniref:outer membrane beta-barrel protein n=1 Tax=Ideonella sp. TaxID=1929293 RepID=UPI003BB7D29B
MKTAETEALPVRAASHRARLALSGLQAMKLGLVIWGPALLSVPAWAERGPPPWPRPALAAEAPAEVGTDPSAAPVPLAFQPQAVALGPFLVVPQFTLATGRNDNLRLQQRDPLTSRFWVATPGVSVVLPVGDDRYELGLRAEWTRQVDSPLDNTRNAEATLDGQMLLGPQTAMAWKLAAQDWHDVVASASNVFEKPKSADHFRAGALAAVLRHELDENTVRLEAEATASARRYQNHREVTVAADVDTLQLVARAQQVFAPQRRLGVEARATRARYPWGQLALDNLDRRAYLTGQIEPGEAWSGGLKLGLQHKRFEAQGSYTRPAWMGLSWEADLRWQHPRGHQFDWSSQRAASDGPGDAANRVLGVRHQASWTQLLPES